MKQFLSTLTVTALLAGSLPVSAQTVVHKLGVSPVVGQLRSTAELRAHSAQLLTAAKTLGLTHDEYSAVSSVLKPADTNAVMEYGPIPRHLDAMTSAGGHVLHNVIIPPNQYGWHFTLYEGNRRTDFYIPNACGNISIVRTTVPPVRSPIHAALPTATITITYILVVTQATDTPSPAPTFAPNKTFWQRYGTVLGAVIVPIVACAFAGCFKGGSPPPVHHHRHFPTPPPSPTPRPSHSPRPTPPPTPTPIPPTPTPVPPTPTPKPTATASCPPGALALSESAEAQP